MMVGLIFGGNDVAYRNDKVEVDLNLFTHNWHVTQNSKMTIHLQNFSMHSELYRKVNPTYQQCV